jgi:hypothetical protein
MLRSLWDILHDLKCLNPLKNNKGVADSITAIHTVLAKFLHPHMEAHKQELLVYHG